MTKPELLDFFKRHAASQSAYVAEARAAVLGASCDSGVSSSAICCAELLSTYTLRAEHVKSLGTSHAVRLQREIAALCTALEHAVEHSARIFHVTLRDGRTLIFFEDVSTSEILGALASYDARKLSDDEWFRIWGTRRP